MSRATAYVRFSDGLVMTTLYNGTVDVLFDRLLPIDEDPWGNLYWCYKNGDYGRLIGACTCTCGQPDEPVTAATDYGGGYSWKSRACRVCQVMTGSRDPWRPDLDKKPEPEGVEKAFASWGWEPDDGYREPTDGLPAWWPKLS